ncbi:single-stranded DNA-binding protein [Isoptericola sediminis]|uniref:Single-stranded DNA-binding protein n=1 Tax=Isoptericola sediminis TaxID=2733572 RepID=A0A849K588_9MICO|nr:single-stranded DNA-binding protein [Isoptericola sediminis]NNU28061.1 single-stranded DNA-binding protein [Isoptericola sediminis]
MSDAKVTVTGYVGTTPVLHLSAHDVPWTSFRVGSTRRLRDAATGEWRDGRTTWFTVKAFRGAARTICESITPGQPVVVTGRPSTEEWVDKEGRDRYALIIDADAVGPDATRGLTRFTKVTHDDPATERAPAGPTASADPWDDGSDAAADRDGADDPDEALDPAAEAAVA